MLIAGTSTTLDQESELVLLQQQRAGPTNQRDDIITTISLSDWFAADVPFFRMYLKVMTFIVKRQRCRVSAY